MRKAAIAMAQKAIAIDDNFAWAYTALAMNYLGDRQYDKAVAAARKAVQLQPSNADAQGFLGFFLTQAGRPDDGIPYIQTALRLSPRWFGPYLNFLGQASFHAGRYKEAVSIYEENARRHGPIYHNILAYWAASYVMTGQLDSAKSLVQRIGKRFPKLSISSWPPLVPPALYRHQDGVEIFWSAMRKAGFPD